MKRRVISILIESYFEVLFAGCAKQLRNRELSNVAKDWSLVVRASQVIPVYPLTEDLQPGDVLLVSDPIDDQVKIYKKRGFLPLDQHMVRLYPKEYCQFYDSRYGIDNDLCPAKKWQTTNEDGKSNWDMAPHVAFPPYQFSVSASSGTNIALPVQGVPFALGLMNSGKASGSVTISDAYTYGLDDYRLQKIVRYWARENQSFLRNYEPKGKNQQFLRVVSRVFIASKVDISITNDEATASKASAGNESPVSTLQISKDSSDNNFKKAMTALGDMAKSQLPGANISVATATNRSVMLKEEFKRPLVFGYVGFDMPILRNGILGVPISTLGQLSGIRASIHSDLSDNAKAYRLASLAHMYNALKNISGSAADSIRAKLDDLHRVLPATYSFSLYSAKSPKQVEKDTKVIDGAAVSAKDFQSVLDYAGNAISTVEVLDAFIKNNGSNSEYDVNLKKAVKARDDISNSLGSEPEIMNAIDFVFFQE